MTLVLRILINTVLLYLGFLASFALRFGVPFPPNDFHAIKSCFVFLTLIHISTLSLFRVYRGRFRSSWELFQKVSLGMGLGTLLSVAFVWVFRHRWGEFPTGVFVISFFITLPLIFKANRFILRRKKRIKKQVVILGEGKVDDIIGKKANVERKRINQISELLKYSNIDEIVVSEEIIDVKDLNLLLYLEQQFKADILFSPPVYMKLLPERINGNSPVELLSTFVGRKSELDEFFIAILDISVSLILLILAAIPMLIISIIIMLTSRGKVIYKQKRVGKDGKIFTLYKFRTMVKDAEKMSGFAPATNGDLRVTKIGKLLRRIRFDELPQLLNILQGKMSLVGPRPENLHRVYTHKALQGIRLAVKPGLTGLAQVKSAYDLHPKHKVRYDFLYIQRRSLGLNAYILLQTIPAVFSKKGW